MATQAERRTKVHIRWMVRADYQKVMSVEADSFECGWTEDDFRRAARQRYIINMVAEHGDEVVGYFVYELHQNYLQMLTLAVAPGWRRRGVGRQMVNKLVAKLTPEYRTHLIVEVPETNLAGQLFFRACGFRAVEIRRCVFGDEDGYLMRLDFDDRLLPNKEV